VAQDISAVAVLVAGGDYQHAEAHNVLDLMHRLRGLAWIGNVRCQAGRKAEALLDFARSAGHHWRRSPRHRRRR
jgi:hypothetical protein